MKINFTFSGGQKLRIFGRSWNFLTSQFWNLEQFFWNLVRMIIWHLTLFYFTASDRVVPIQPGDTSNVEETSYFTAGFAFHKMFKSVARFVSAAIKQNPRQSRNRLHSLEGLKLGIVTGIIHWSSHFCNILFPKLWQKQYFQESSTYIKHSKYDKIDVLIEWWNFVRSQLMIQSL